MDKKTTQRVINNMGEKIEALEDKIKALDKLERLGHDAWFKDNKKIDALDDKIKRLDTSAYNNLANLEIDINARLEKLEKINLLNADRNKKYMEHFESFDKRCNDLFKLCKLADKRIDKISEIADNINKRCDVSTNFDEKIINCLEIINERIHHLKSDIKELAKNDLDLESKIVENYDDLEAKNFVVKRDIDTAIYDNEMFLKQLEDKFINNNEGSNNE